MKPHRTRTGPGALDQRGAALFFSLIILGLMTLLAISAYNMGSVNLKIVSNVQARQETTAAADQVAQQVLGTTDFALGTQPYTTAADVDVNNDGTVDYSATVAASCLTYRAYPAPGQVLDPGDTCTGSALGGAFCNQTLWDVQSQAAPTAGTAYAGNRGSSVTIHQGASMIMSIEGSLTACP